MGMEENNEYTICFRYIIFTMKMLAVYPFFPLHEVFDISDVFSKIFTIISVLLFAWVSLEEQMHIYNLLIDLLDDFCFLQIIEILPGICIRILVLISPCITWNKTRHFRNYQNNWKRFQVETEKLTKKSFKCSIKHKIQSVFIINMICSSVLTVLIKTSEWDGRTETSLLSGLYIMNGTANMMTYWVVNNMYTIFSTKELTKLIERSINEDRDVDLRRLIDLWMTLCDLNEQFIICHSILFLFFFCLATVCGVVCAYNTVFLFVFLPDKSLGFTYLVATVLCMLSLMTFCESANSVTKYIVFKSRRILLVENVSNKNTKLLQIIARFLQTIDTKNPQVTFNGYIAMDRSALSSVLGTVISFLVVMRQFTPVQVDSC